MGMSTKDVANLGGLFVPRESAKDYVPQSDALYFRHAGDGKPDGTNIRVRWGSPSRGGYE